MNSVVANSPAAWGARAAAATPWEAALWSRRGQRSRFDALLRHLVLADGDVLLDYGCGHGALCGLLPPKVSYVGYDWAPEMLERCKAEHARATVTAELPTLVDHVVAVGPFNLADGWWKQRSWDTLADLWARSRKTLSVSVYRGEDPACIRYSELDLLAFAKGQRCRRFLVDASYLDNDLLLVMSR